MRRVPRLRDSLSRRLRARRALARRHAPRGALRRRRLPPSHDQLHGDGARRSAASASPPAPTRARTDRTSSRRLPRSAAIGSRPSRRPLAILEPMTVVGPKSGMLVCASLENGFQFQELGYAPRRRRHQQRSGRSRPPPDAAAARRSGGGRREQRRDQSAAALRGRPHDVPGPRSDDRVSHPRAPQRRGRPAPRARADRCEAFVPAHAAHGHVVVCTSCGTATEFTDCDMSPVLEAAARETGYAISDHFLQLSGLCAVCGRSAAAKLPINAPTQSPIQAPTKTAARPEAASRRAGPGSAGSSR